MATAAETITIYNAVLQRDPTDAELAAFVANSQTASAQSQQIDLLVNSSEANSTVDPIVRVFQATFGRVPDKAGLDFWTDFYRSSGDVGQPGATPALTTINQGFVNSTEFQARFPTAAANGTVTDDFLNALYQQTLGRAPDQAGRDFYIGKSIASTVTAFAQASEFINLSNSQVNLFLSKAGNMTQDYDGSVFDTNDDGKVDGADTAPPVTPGQTFTLTAPPAAPDNLTGTGGNDTFRAIDANSLASSDQINGAGGDDVLDISDNAILGANAAPVIGSVERVNNSDANATLNLSSVTGVDSVWSVGAPVAGDTFTYTNGSVSTTFGASGGTLARNVNVDFTGSFAGPSDAVKFAVDDNNTGTVTFQSPDAAGIEIVNLLAAGEGGPSTGNGVADQVNLNAFTAAKTVNVTGAGNVQVIDTVTGLTNFNAGTATGNVAFQSGVLTSAFTATGGSGADMLDFTAAGATAPGTIMGGGGNDILRGGAANDRIDGGGGADTMTGNGGADTFVIKTDSMGVNGQDIITGADFVTTVDKLAFGSIAGSATNFTQVTGGTDYISARSAAETAFLGGASLEYVAVQAGADNYVFYDANGDNVLDDNGVDAAVQLTTTGAIAFGDIIAI